MTIKITDKNINSAAKTISASLRLNPVLIDFQPGTGSQFSICLTLVPKRLIVSIIGWLGRCCAFPVGEELGEGYVAEKLGLEKWPLDWRPIAKLLNLVQADLASDRSGRGGDR